MDIVIVDDDLILAELLEGKVKKILGDVNEISMFHKEFHKILKKVHIDIVFMDIELKKENGIDLYSKIGAKFPQAKVIFMSSHLKYSQEIFESKPTYFLIKPIEDQRLEMALNQAQKVISTENKEFIIHTKESYIRLKETEIIYIQSDKRKISVATEKTVHEYYEKLNNVELQLGERFCRCHQSFIVNFDYVKYLEQKEFILLDKTSIPISKTNYPRVRDKFTLYMGDI